MIKITQYTQLPYWLFTSAILMGLILPVLIMDGMFMDGVLYACVSKNLANGYGSWWFLKYSEFGFAEHLTFHEHPPLIFWIQASFFKVLGNGMYTERIYSFLTAVITAYLIVKTWKIYAHENQSLSKLSWMAIVFWITIPVCFWSYQNNMQENTMGIFCLLSVIFTLKAIHLHQKPWLHLLLAGIMIFCAGFSKGIPGLFTLGVVFFHWLIFRKQSFGKMVVQNGFVILVTFGILGLILLNPEAKESLSIYFNDRLLGRVDHGHTRESHFYILQRIFWELLPGFILVGIIHLVLRIKKKANKIVKPHLQWFLLFMIIGLCGSVPIMLTLVQKTFYFVGSLPYFGIALAILVAPVLTESISKVKPQSKGFKVATILGALACVVVLIVTIMQIGKVSRNEEVLHDLYIVDDYIPENSLINVHPSMGNEWDMRVYLIRYWRISLDLQAEGNREFYLMNKEINAHPGDAYTKIELPTVKYDLYRRSNL